MRGAKLGINGVVGEEIVTELNSYPSADDWKARRRRYEARPSPDFRTRNDYAVALMHLGEAKLAIPILRAIENERAGSYINAANLGTAYELAGDDREALRWIREAIRRNAQAHDGTEWLHVRILEAKIALAAEPTWLANHSILGVDFGDRVVPKTPAALPRGNHGKAVRLDDLKYALWYQLDERYQFVRPPNVVVASLLFDWANVMFRTDALESAEALYRESLRYGAPRRHIADARLRRVRQMLADYSTR
jgi:tetratricopeptide (TPR) repeat protein